MFTIIFTCSSSLPWLRIPHLSYPTHYSWHKCVCLGCSADVFACSPHFSSFCTAIIHKRVWVRKLIVCLAMLTSGFPQLKPCADSTSGWLCCAAWMAGSCHGLLAFRPSLASTRRMLYTAELRQTGNVLGPPCGWSFLLHHQLLCAHKDGCCLPFSPALIFPLPLSPLPIITGSSVTQQCPRNPFHPLALNSSVSDST